MEIKPNRHLIAPAILLSLGTCFAQNTEKPNIVFFLVDDMGYKDLGCYGAKLYETPNIDRLAQKGVRFTDAYTSAPISSPTRASVMTGIHPLKMKMVTHLDYIPQGHKILPAFLKEKGYTTWHVGKWHLGNPDDKTMPTDLGFDVNIGGSISSAPGSYFWPYATKEDGTPMRHPRNYVPLREGGSQGEQLTDRLTKEAVILIQKHKEDEPFYLNFWYYSLHNKKEAKAELIEKYEKKIAEMKIKPTWRYHQYVGDSILTSESNALYAAMIETVDNSVGEIVKILKEKGLYDNTLFVFYSDNGPTTDDVPCAPFMGGKNTTYEAGIRMPAFFSWKNQIPSKRVSSDRIIIMDIFNTLLDAADVDSPNSYGKDGISLIPHLVDGESVLKRDFYWHYPHNRRHWAGRSSAAILAKDGFKYIYFYEGDQPELYDMNTDKAETKDLYKKHQSKAEELSKNLSIFLSRCGFNQMESDMNK